ncbi:MAG: hypothetical protein JSS34_02515 [Proteobacteria bacterium]|nr:hypothetical protein [Pseudomonadota bacterium]
MKTKERFFKYGLLITLSLLSVTVLENESHAAVMESPTVKLIVAPSALDLNNGSQSSTFYTIGWKKVSGSFFVSENSLIAQIYINSQQMETPGTYPLVSPCSGVVTTQIREGTLIQPGQTLGQITCSS